MARDGAGADGLDGQRPRAGRPVGQGAAAVQLLQAALRAGHQPADRPDPRVDRDEPRAPASAPEGNLLDGVARARAPARDRAADPAQRTSSRSCARSTTRSSGRTRSTSPGRPRTGAEGMSSARCERICAEASEVVEDGVNVLILSDRRVGAGRARDPVAARHRGRPPPPRARGHAPADRPRDRVRRAARGPPLLHADRLRRGRGRRRT